MKIGEVFYDVTGDLFGICSDCPRLATWEAGVPSHNVRVWMCGVEHCFTEHTPALKEKRPDLYVRQFDASMEEGYYEYLDKLPANMEAYERMLHDKADQDLQEAGEED